MSHFLAQLIKLVDCFVIGRLLSFMSSVQIRRGLLFRSRYNLLSVCLDTLIHPLWRSWKVERMLSQNHVRLAILLPRISLLGLVDLGRPVPCLDMVISVMIL